MANVRSTEVASEALIVSEALIDNFEKAAFKRDVDTTNVGAEDQRSRRSGVPCVRCVVFVAPAAWSARSLTRLQTVGFPIISPGRYDHFVLLTQRRLIKT